MRVPKVIDSTISGNSADNDGGGISIVWESGEVINSTISGNTAGFGGGIHIDNDDLSGTITVTNSTISGNVATYEGGGIFWENSTTLFMTSSTITGNSAGERGGGLHEAASTINMGSTIIAGNTAPGSPDCLFSFFEGSNDGYNLIGNTGGCDFESVEGDLINVDPVLGPLQDNGGPTFTHALLGGSPAIDQIPSLDCEGTTDQRGVTKPQGPTCDIGSYELEQAEFTVDSTADVGDSNPGDGVCDDGVGNCTLRAAIEEANALAGSDTITLPVGTYNNSSGNLDITDDLTITGAGATDTIIDGSGIHILSGIVDISGVTIQNGTGIDNAGNLTFTDSTVRNSVGGFVAIYNGPTGNLTLVRSTLTDNDAAGIFNDGESTLINSTVSNNFAYDYGGIFNEWRGTLTLTNTTVSGNSTGIEGHGGGIYNVGTLFVNNSTIIDNEADLRGGGIHNSPGGVVRMINTIVAQNTASVGLDCYGSPISKGYNWIGDGTGCGLIQKETDLVGTNSSPIDPLLGPLQNNGGATETHALLAGSPAIDAIPVADCNDTFAVPITADQRGVVRPQGPACDIGSFELEQAEFTVDSTDSTADVNLGDGVCEDGAGNCTLRAAVQEANALGGQNTINLPAGTYDLAYIITIETDLAIVGTGAADTIVVGVGNSSNVFDIMSGTVTISDLTVKGGGPGIYNDGTLNLINVTIDGGNPPSCQHGGINNRGSLTLINSTVRDYFSYSFGAGIYNGMGANLTLTNSTVSGNLASLEMSGGGIYNDYTGNLTLINSTVSGNEADRDGGGIFNGGIMTLISSTISNNKAGSYGGIANDEYFEDAVVTILVNTIVAQNTGSGGPDCGGTYFSPITSVGYNLIGNGTGCDFTAAIGDQIGTDESPIDPLLGPLQDNGGPTETHALLTGSPAIDAIPIADCNDTLDVPITTDQRGVARPQGTACDIGSFELEQVIEEATRFDVQLNGDGAVPAVDTAALGRGRFELNASETGIRGTLLVGDILGVTAAHIHCGLTGETGPVGITLVELAQPVDFVEPTRQSWSIFAPDEGNGCGWVNVDDIVTAMRDGGSYVNIHTVAWPGGEIRGQLVAQ